MKTYKLQSSGLVHTPGLIAWAINGYHFKRDRRQLRRVVVDTFNGLTDDAAHKLLSKAIPYELDGDTVVFSVEDGSTAKAA